jgi:hypothetical protein
MFPTESTEHRRSIAKGWKLTFWKRLYGGLPLASWPNAKLSLMSDERRCGHRSMGRGKKACCGQLSLEESTRFSKVLRQFEESSAALGGDGELGCSEAWQACWQAGSESSSIQQQQRSSDPSFPSVALLCPSLPFASLRFPSTSHRATLRAAQLARFELRGQDQLRGRSAGTGKAHDAPPMQATGEPQGAAGV